MNLSNCPDWLLIQEANQVESDEDMVADEELECRYREIKEELKAYEEYQQNG